MPLTKHAANIQKKYDDRVFLQENLLVKANNVIITTFQTTSVCLNEIFISLCFHKELAHFAASAPPKMNFGGN